MAYKHNKEWRRTHPEACLAMKLRNYAQTGSPEKNENWGQRWTSREDIAALNKEIPDRELHRLLGRSVQAIQIRRSSLRKLPINFFDKGNPN